LGSYFKSHGMNCEDRMENDCIWQADCKDSDDVHCCEEYREKAQGHCFATGACIKTKIFEPRTKESER
jgi:hypothetical protein